jgi:hypothetical protein
MSRGALFPQGLAFRARLADGSTGALAPRKAGPSGTGRCRAGEGRG